MSVKFIPRTSKPADDNKYYIRTSEGGYSGAIYGKPKDEKLTILSNCAGYSQARLCEASQRGKIDLLEPCNPKDYEKYLYGKCTIGQKAKLGAIAVWVQDEGNGSHAGNVEGIVDEFTIVTSESHYGGNAFDLNVHTTENGKKFYKPGYTFKHFIYSPDIDTNSEKDDYTELLADYEALKSNYEIMKVNLADIENKLYNISASYENERLLTDTLKREREGLLSQISETSNSYDNKVAKLEKEQKTLKSKLLAANGKLADFESRIPGDINNDGRVDLQDLIALLSILLKRKNKNE